MLIVYNDVFTNDKNLELYKTILYNNSFTYGEADRNDTQPTGMVLNLSLDGVLFKEFYDAVTRNHFAVKDLEVQRAYINLFFPNENPYFHNDGNVITCLFYITPEYDIDEGGETQFVIDDNIVGIKAKPARLVVFDGKIVHRATSFRNYPRITVALKFIAE
jgi:hypothetical protein